MNLFTAEEKVVKCMRPSSYILPCVTAERSEKNFTNMTLIWILLITTFFCPFALL